MDSLHDLSRLEGGSFSKRTIPLPELQSQLTELVHHDSGARILYIGNDDPENLFCLSFQTLPEDSTGVAHILEHTVLCGSEKFPVKDPFFAMTRRSLNTYMNALTGQDFTCYPASSLVEKDFYNLLEVYLDSVFHPELKKMSFLQEGHRLEFTEPKNPNSPLQFSGVVYNEMKGAMSSIDSRLWQALAVHLTPDLTYAHNSGGDPKEIPSLTYEELKAFHQKFYHPSRCLFFFYGNIPLQKHIDFILPTLQKAKKLEPLPPLKKQKRLTSPVYTTARYPIAKTEPTDKKTQIVFSWLTVPIADQETLLALSLLESILMDTDASFVTKRLLKSKLCDSVDTFLDAEMSEIPWAIVCKGCDTANADALQKVLFDALKTVKIKEDEVEAALHQLEFQRLEIGAEGVPFGLTLFMRAALLEQHGSKPENALLVHSLFDNLRQKLKDPNYLPGIIRTQLLENPHFVRLCLVPDPNLEDEEKEEEQKRLQEIQSRLSSLQKEEIVKQSEELSVYQESVEHQSIECLPKVTLKDVPPFAQDLPLGKRGSLYHHNAFTNQILFADLVYELPDLKKEELSLLSLMTHLIGEVGCGSKSYEEALNFQQAYIGGFDAHLNLHIPYGNPQICRPTISLRGKALYRNSRQLFELFSDYSHNAHLEDEERVKEWLLQHATDLESRLTRSSMSFATAAALSHLSVPSFIYEQWHGLPYYQSVLNWAKNPKQIATQLKELSTRVLGAKKPDLVLCCDEEQKQKIEKELLGTLDFPEKERSTFNPSFALSPPSSHAHIIAAPVAFTACGLNTVSYGAFDAPHLLIAAELMKHITLHKEIREKGGAYGSGAVYSPSTGNFHFYSYRDPNLHTTLAAFELSIEAIISRSFNERELEEAKLSTLQSIDAPIPPSSKAAGAYGWSRTNRSFERRQAFRKAVLSATADEIAKAVSRCLKDKPTTFVSMLGQSVYDKEAPLLSHKLPILPL